MRIALSGISVDEHLGTLKAELEPLHLANDLFLGEVILDLAADAIEEAGGSRESPIEFATIRERYLPECGAHTKEQHYKSEFAIRAAAMIRAGVDPGLLDEVAWWRLDDLWMWAVDALVIYVRVAADRTAVQVGQICERLAQRRGIDLGTPN
jgi:hypothetical protein